MDVIWWRAARCVRAGALVIAAVPALGCGRGPVRNADCEWPGTTPGTSLTDSVKLAEDLAIRFADDRRGPGQRREIREACEARLFQAVASDHGVGLSDVAAAREGLARRGFDWFVNVPMAAVCLALALAVARGVGRRFSPAERMPALVAVVFGALAVAVAVTIAGEVWAGLVETLRIGNGHLSYRAFRVPWRHHREVTFVLAAAAVVVTCGVARGRFVAPAS
jgi:hypothetical protein